MPISSRGGPDFSIVGFLLLAAFGTFVWKTAPLDSSRPGGDTTGWYEKNIIRTPAMLWQDPFKAIYGNERVQQIITGLGADNQQRQKIAGQASNVSDIYARYACTIDNLITTPITANTHLRVLAAMVSTTSQPEDEERRRRIRYAVVSGLGEAKYIPETPDSIGFCLIRKSATAQQGDAGNKQTMHPGTDEESQYFEVPYEWYDHEAGGDANNLDERVLLLWLDESRFIEPPLARFTEFFTPLGGQTMGIARKNLDIFILGPARSMTLQKLVQRANDEGWTTQQIRDVLNKLNVNSIHILSPFATVPDKNLLIKKTRANESADILKLLSPEKCKPNSNSANGGSCITFMRTINDDATIAHQVVDELGLRISALRMRKPKSGDPSPKVSRTHKVHIALISEWDTPFGRALPRVFTEELDDYVDQLNRSRKSQVQLVIERFSYLRGIDGRGPTVKESGKGENTDKSKTRTGDPFAFKPTDIRRPNGPAQYDYLRRLASELKQRNDEYVRQGGSGYQAIGILGSDVFDKLLLLSALRGEFPGVNFFTTDLDAQLLHPADFEWTRNLIIGSSFDLKLNRELQDKIPPFRDSYQTSAYLATRLATDLGYPICNWHFKNGKLFECNNQTQFQQQIPPLLFEVGREGAVPLYLTPNDGRQDTTAQPVREQPHGNAYVLAIVFLLAVVALALHQIKPASGSLIIGLAIAALGGLYLLMKAASASRIGDPVSFTEGVSIWPTFFIRYLALCLSAAFLFRFFRGVGMNSARLSREYFQFQREIFPRPRPPRTFSQLYCAVMAVVKRLKHCDSGHLLKRTWKNLWNVRRWHRSDSPAWMFLVILLIVVARELNGLQRMQAKTAALMDVLPGIVIGWTALILVWLVISNHLIKVRSINRWQTGSLFYTSHRQDGEDTRQEAKSRLHAKVHWLQYALLGRPRERILRTVTIWLIYTAFSALLFILLPSSHSPCRGKIDCDLDTLLVKTSVLGMLFLLFLVLDAYRLCIYWMRGLNTHSVYWDDVRIDKTEATMQIPRKCSVALNKINLIAERTSEISSLIYYPFVIIILLLISRSSYIDNWELPQAVAIVILMNVAFIIVSGLKLHHEALKIRKECLLTMEQERIANIKDKDTEKQITYLIDQVKNIKAGAFLPLFEQPIFRAAILLAGAIGLSVSEYAMIFN